MGPVTLSEIAAALSGLLAEAGSFPEGEAYAYGEAAGWAEGPAAFETAAPYGEDPALVPQDDPAGVIEAIAEPILLADLWGEELDRTQVGRTVRSLTAYQDVYGGRLDEVIAMLLVYAESLPGGTEETGVRED